MEVSAVGRLPFRIWHARGISAKPRLRGCRRAVCAGAGKRSHGPARRLLMDPSLRERFLRIYAETKTIAVVGASADPSKPAHQIPRYLQRQGYRILPVNPRGGELRSEEHTSELQSHHDLVCRLLLE